MVGGHLNFREIRGEEDFTQSASWGFRGKLLRTFVWKESVCRVTPDVGLAPSAALEGPSPPPLVP